MQVGLSEKTTPIQCKRVERGVSLGIWMAIGIVLAGLAGCSTVVANSPQKNSLLRPAQMSPDAVGLEIFFIRLPLGDPEANHLLWQEVDEQALPVSVRRALWKNGFRAAVVGTSVPVRLARLLKMSDHPSPAHQEGLCRVQLQEAQKIEPWISCRKLSLRAGCRSEVIASGIYEEMTILRPEPQGVGGQTFRKAQGLFGLYVQPMADARVQLELVPEVHYGEPAQRWVGDQGMFRLEVRRERQVFTELTIQSRLAPGEMLLVSCLPDREGSLGWYFFTQTTGGDPQQKLLLVRLAQTQHDPLFETEPSLPTTATRGPQ
ncbi:MAG: hypothetical protein NZ602_10100 [Thermoguttaceae bacterium]|nr:hypothetical protein [Thermoguttaceae bacterium]MDW8039355.1 hypothetical protein [Thermoguttaceae bacterium]